MQKKNCHTYLTLYSIYGARHGKRYIRTVDVNYWNAKAKQTTLLIMHFAVKKTTTFIVKMSNKMTFSFEKIIGSCKFFLNIVTTKMSPNMTEFTFSRGVPHIYFYCLCNWCRFRSAGTSMPSDQDLHWSFLVQNVPNESKVRADLDLHCSLWRNSNIP
jgi:hypothetical protein